MATRRQHRGTIQQNTKLPSPATLRDPVQVAGAWVLAVTAFLAPFLGWQGGPVLFFEPMFDSMQRRMALFLVAGLLIALMLIAWARTRRIGWRFHLLDLLVGLFTLGLLVSGACSLYPQLAFFGPLWNQIALPYVGTGILLYVGARAFLQHPADRRRVAMALVLAGGIVALQGLLDRFTPGGYAASFHPARLTGILRNPMFTGLYLAMLIPLALGLTQTVERQWQRLLLLACAGLMALALVLTLTRSAWLGFAASLLLLALATAWRYRGTLARPLQFGALGAVAALILLAICLPTVRQRLQSMVNLRDATVQSRLVYMQSAWGMFRARPLAGWGIGTFTLIAPEFRPATAVKEGGVSINRVAALALPHNLPLQYAAETGLLGVVPFLALLLAALFAGAWLKSPTPQQWGMTWGLVGLVCAYLVTNLFSFDISITLANCWLALALLASTTAREETATFKPTFGSPVAALLYSLAAVISLGTLYWGVGDTVASSDTFLGTRKAFTEARALVRNPARCLQASEEGIKLLKEAITARPCAGFVSTRYLAMAYREQMLLLRTTNPSASNQAREAMFRYGNRALAMMDRDPEMLLYLSIEYLDCNRFEEARSLLKRVLVYLPNSAQAHLLQAKLLAFDHNLDASEKEAKFALSLDPEYGRAYLWLARIQCIKLDRILLGQQPGRSAAALVTGQDHAGRQLADAAVATFTQAERFGVRFDDSDRMKYTTTLFLANQEARGIEEGRIITDPQQQRILADRVNYFYTVRGKAQAGHTVIARLQQPTPAVQAPQPALPAIDPLAEMPWKP